MGVATRRSLKKGITFERMMTKKVKRKCSRLLLLMGWEGIRKRGTLECVVLNLELNLKSLLTSLEDAV